MEAVQLGGFAASDEGAEVDVGRARVGHGWDAQLAEEVDAVGGDGDTDGGEVLGAKCGELLVIKVLLYLSYISNC